MEQRRRAIEALPFEAVNIMVGDEPEHAETAARVGASWVDCGNETLGKKFNAGYARARDLGCSHVMAIGSDSFIDPETVGNLPFFPDRATALTGLSAFKPDGSERFDLFIRYPAGFGVAMFYPMSALPAEPCDPSKKKGCDSSTWRRSGLGKIACEFVRPTKGSYVNFASPDVQVTDYSALQVHRRTSLLERRPEHVFGDLRSIYDADLVDSIEGLYAARALGLFLTGCTPHEKSLRAREERRKRIESYRSGTGVRISGARRPGGQGARR